ncbi:putative bifunctional diguanylate cyclase/phosphodiesterase [Actinoplanes sp. NPDC049265]|uniref:putative bifunctional diguanylate cyclase/phosphodiesterase n=1 Tax=Actinoplanes sp. NPDC049265 TaxID=3363902 RepID=UPI0037176E46
MASTRFYPVPSAAALVLVAGVAGLIDPLPALAAGVGVTALWAFVLLAWKSFRMHQAAGGVFAECRGAGFVSLGAVCAGFTAVVPLVVDGPATRIVTVGQGLSALFFILGAMLLPGASASMPVRLRRAFDGVGLGISLAFAAWLITPMSDSTPTELGSTLCSAAGVAIVAVSVVRSRPYRRAVLICGVGAVVAQIGMCVIANLLSFGHLGPLVPLFALPVVAGLAMSAYGGTRGSTTPPVYADTREPDQYLTGYPLLAVPAAIGVMAAAYHLITVGWFDPVAVALGLTMVGILSLRELLVVSDIRRYAGRLKTKEAHFRSLVAGATDLTLVLNEDLVVTWQSPAAARLFGLEEDEVVGRNFRELIHPDDVAEAQQVIHSVIEGGHEDGPPALVSARLKDGQKAWRDTESTVSDQRSVPEVAALVVHVRDVGERRQLERKLHRMSYTDQLTGLANRRALMRDLLEYRRRPGQQGTLLVIDLHGLAEINDSKGRETGDAVLIEVGRRIRGLLGDEDMAARLGGDEFAVLTADGAVLAYALATRIVTLLMEPYQLPGVIVELHTSVGLAELAGGADSDEVMRHADLARSRARQLGRDRVEWYDTDVEIQLHRRMDLEQQLLDAADNGELDLVYQPVVGLRDRQPVGVEALLRWRHPKLGTIMPAELLPIARAVGIAAELDDWVLDTACHQLNNWAGGESDFWLSVNVSPKELLAAGFAARVEKILRRHHLPPERLVVEVAETWIAEDVPAIVASLAGLRKLGVRAALDDFGAGHASLSHLRRLPVDVLKLDRVLVNTPTEANSAAVLGVVVSLGKRLGLEIVAKGLETDEEITRAREAGCLYGQGFALARPAPAERIEAYLESHRASQS